MMKSIKRNFIYNILLNVSSVIFPLITAPYVSRVLEPDGVGLFNFSFTYAGYFALVAKLGIPTYGAREVSKLRNDSQKLSCLISELLSISAYVSLIVSFVYLASVALIGQLSSNYIIFLVAGFAVYLSPFQINWYFQGIEEFGYITFRNLTVRILGILCLFLFVRDKDDLLIYVVINVLSGIVADIWNFLMLKSHGINIGIVCKGLLPHVKPLLILFASTLAISIYTVLDTLMLGFMCNYSEVGYYNNAIHITKTILAVITSLSIVALPRVAYYKKENDFVKIKAIVNKSISFVSLMAFPIVSALICISSIFVPLFLGDKFEGAVVPLMILSLLVIFIGLSNIFGMQVLIGLGYDSCFLRSMVSGAILNFLLNYLLIPSYGSIGASVSSVVAEFVVMIMTLFYMKNRTDIQISCWQDILKSLLGSLLLFPLMFVIKSYFGGWLLLAVFAILASIIYLCFESIVRNSSITLFKSTIRQFFVNHTSQL